jgi:hypothetical protein
MAIYDGPYMVIITNKSRNAVWHRQKASVQLVITERFARKSRLICDMVVKVRVTTPTGKVSEQRYEK